MQANTGIIRNDSKCVRYAIPPRAMLIPEHVTRGPRAFGQQEQACRLELTLIKKKNGALLYVSSF